MASNGKDGAQTGGSRRFSGGEMNWQGGPSKASTRHAPPFARGVVGVAGGNPLNSQISQLMIITSYKEGTGNHYNLSNDLKNDDLKHSIPFPTFPSPFLLIKSAKHRLLCQACKSDLMA